MITLSLFLCSCNNNHYIDAVYQYRAEIHNHTYTMQITLNKEGTAYLRILEKPIIEDLGDIRNLTPLYEGSVRGIYRREKDPDSYFIYQTGGAPFFDASALKLVQTITLGDDGYVYYCYTYDSWGTDEEDCDKKVARYTRIK